MALEQARNEAPEPTEEMKQALGSFYFLLRNIANNVNQIAHNAHISRWQTGEGMEQNQ